jgi:subfamily B ATP-binding cassette protein MsbA
VPFTLESVIIGVTVVLAIRYGITILVAWLREKIRRNYKRHLQNQLFERSIDAQINYFDEEGGEEILNAIVTEADFGSKVLQYFFRIYQIAILPIAYLVLAFYFSAQLTVFTVIVMGAITVVIRQRMESATV